MWDKSKGKQSQNQDKIYWDNIEFIPRGVKRDSVSFEAFLVGNQGWRINGQMLR